MNLPRVILKNATHNNIEVVQIIFSRHEKILELIKIKPEIRWSRTMRCWYLPNRSGIKLELFQLLDGTALLDYNDKQNNLNTVKVNSYVPVSLPKTKPARELKDVSPEALDKIKEFTNWLRSKRYSASTIGTYADAIRIFLRFFSKKTVSEINNNDVILFNNQYILANKFSASYQNQVVNAIKLFFKTVELKSMETELVHRPKRPKVLPNVLSKEEVKLILQALSNLKHKAMLSLVYSCGLRRSELLNLKLSDIDSNRHLIIIKQAKGRKDRIAPLSEKILLILRDYFIAYRPKCWLFEGQDKSGQYDGRSLASVLKQALEKSKIAKPVTLHWLRHSYATHLLENGTDLRYIQEILGHSSSRTTEIYTHVSNKSIQRIISPFDSL